MDRTVLVELKLIEALTGAKVTRQQYIFKGQPICGYLIDPGTAGLPAESDPPTIARRLAITNENSSKSDS